MDLFIGVLLFGAGVIGGALSGMVGGASMVTFPALLAAGLPPINAAACNIVAAIPSNFAAAMMDRKRLPRLDRPFLAFAGASVLGAGVGALLLVMTPQRLFEVLVPFLLAFATILFATSRRIAGWLRARAEARGRTVDAVNPNSIPLMLPVSVYGGYFGAGVGVLALAVLSLGAEGDYRIANMTKNIVMGLNTIVAAVVLSAQGVVAWPPTFMMMAGTVLGGMMGGHLVGVVPQPVMRVLVVAVGVILTVAFVWRYWL